MRRLQPAVLLVAIAAAEYLLPGRTAARAVALGLAVLLTVRFTWQSLRHFRMAARVAAVLKTRFLELALTTSALALVASKLVVWARELARPGSAPLLDPVYRQYAAAFLFVAAVRLLVGDFPVRRILHRLELRPAQTVAVGFASAIFAGTLLLSLPLAVTRLEDLSILDALFTATSAVTTTGLVVYDPGRFHTAFGQVVLLALFQLGALGTMAATASLVVLAGRRLRLKRVAALQESLDLGTLGEVAGQVKTIVAITAAVELAGAVTLYVLWRSRDDVAAPAFAALFHAVSAFCTAGFSTFPAGLTTFRDSVATSVVVGALSSVGALGVPVLGAIGHAARGLWSHRRVPLLTLHARLALVTTGALLAGGVLVALVSEWHGALAPLAWPQRIAAAGFLAVTAQTTVGFNTVDTALLTPATLWVLMVLMFIGGSPGSTAGGIKSTTAATVVAALLATLHGRPRVQAFRRTIPDEQVIKALAIGGLSLGILAVGVVVLLAVETADPLALTFEAVSAFGTVGLSAGVTTILNPWGKIVIMVLMFVGRTGPLTLGFALAARARRSHVIFPAEKVMIG